jgi:hypothetical protein
LEAALRVTGASPDDVSAVRAASSEIAGWLRDGGADPELLQFFRALPAMGGEQGAGDEGDILERLERVERDLEAIRRVAPEKPTARAETVAMSFAADADWIDQYRSPLGKRKHLRLCRQGVLPHEKDGYQRLVRRGVIDAYLTRNTKPDKASDVDSIDRELDALGMGES